MGVSLRATKGSALTHGEMDNNFQILTGAGAAKTLASDAFTADTDNGSGSGWYVLTSESASADNLATINGCQAGDVVMLSPAAGHTITIQDGVGNIFCNQSVDIVLANPEEWAMFKRIGSNFYGSKLYEAAP